MLGSVYLFACCVGGLALSAVPDRLGRKNTFLLFGTINALAQLAALYANNYWARLLAMGTMGFFYVKNTVCYNWMYELTEHRHLALDNAVINVWDSSNGIVLCSFYLLVSRDWLPIYSFYVYAGCLALLVQGAFLPESPRFLLINGRKQEAVAALNRISSLNGASHRFTTDDVFAEEEAEEPAGEPAAAAPPARDDDFQSGSKQKPWVTYLLLQLIIITTQFNYFTQALAVATLPGSAFVNGIIYSSADTTAAFIAGLPQEWIADTTLS